jgi:hypothetical protein
MYVHNICSPLVIRSPTLFDHCRDHHQGSLQEYLELLPVIHPWHTSIGLSVILPFLSCHIQIKTPNQMQQFIVKFIA